MVNRIYICQNLSYTAILIPLKLVLKYAYKLWTRQSSSIIILVFCSLGSCLCVGLFLVLFCLKNTIQQFTSSQQPDSQGR